MNIPSLARSALSLCAGLSLALSALPAAAYDATSEFSATQNANGVWSYGSTGSNLNDPLSLYTGTAAAGGADFWVSPGGVPELGKAGAIDYTCCGSVDVPAGTLIAHPGPGGQYSVLRFTAPSAGNYQVSAAFWGDDYAGTTSTDVHIRTAGADAYSGFVAGYGAGSTQGWTGQLSLLQGQTVDFAVGFGPNQNYYYDSTGLSVVITAAVPEPSAAVMLLLGLSGLGGLAWRRRRQAVRS
jgi:hypothetical protein